MNIFNIICYWTDLKKGINYYNPDYLFLKIGNSYEDVYAWAKENYINYYFKPTSDFIPENNSQANLAFNFSVKEVDNIIIKDLGGEDFKASLKLISKIETRKVEVPVE